MSGMTSRMVSSLKVKNMIKERNTFGMIAYWFRAKIPT